MCWQFMLQHWALLQRSVFEGVGVVVRAFADLSALMHRRKRGQDWEEFSEDSSDLCFIQSFCVKGSLSDRISAVRSTQDVASATRLWTLSEVIQLHTDTVCHIDSLEVDGEESTGKHRGRAQSPAEELLSATLDFWASTLEQCRKEINDEGDLEPPENELTAFMQASVAEFHACSFSFRLAVIRQWKRVLDHFENEKILDCRVPLDVWMQVVTAVQMASLDRAERLRRPAVECAGALVRVPAVSEAMKELKLTSSDSTEAQASENGPRPMHLDVWLTRLDPTTVEQCTESVVALRALLPNST